MHLNYPKVFSATNSLNDIKSALFIGCATTSPPSNAIISDYHFTAPDPSVTSAARSSGGRSYLVPIVVGAVLFVCFVIAFIMYRRYEFLLANHRRYVLKSKQFLSCDCTQMQRGLLAFYFLQLGSGKHLSKL